MQLLKDRILKDGQVIGDQVLKVDSFINHQMDAQLMYEMGREFKRRFHSEKITKILTIEASGIAIACLAALHFQVPVIYAKKHQSVNLDKDTYQSSVYSFTKNTSYDVRVARKFLCKEDRVLIIDDFLANGNAATGLVDIVNQAGAEVVGVGIAIEKGFQPGRKVLEDKDIKVESLAIVESMNESKIKFK